MRQREAPSYSSSRVQRATRINGIEAARLEQTLQYLEKAKLHQCRLSNQDIRLISLSMDYIQMSSGHSPEAWRPSEVTRRSSLSPVVSEDEQEESPSQTEASVKPEAPGDNQSPFFLYGERIWERKKRRIQRPMSAVPSRRSSNMADSVLSSLEDDFEASTVSGAQRPRSSPGKHQRVLRHDIASASGRFYSSRDSSSTDSGSSRGRDSPFGVHARNEESKVNRTEGPAIAWGPQQLDSPIIVLSTGLSHASTPRNRVTPHQDWEDDTSHVTKKILKSQAQAQKGGQHSLYLAPSEVMTSATARNVRGLARQIRVSASAPVPDRVERRPPGATPLHSKYDFPPKKPAHLSQDGYNRRATVGEILNQRRPTLGLEAWRSHLGHTSDTPMSLAARRQMVLESRRELNESRNQLISERVKSFMSSQDDSRGVRPKYACR
ncbi:hypothetical protein PoB_004185100 [Plakobranchus ocellatus]|uniref:Uncharacterized protein n=1 Tax=Plakobranchus ocellatus TaxID=259542 RepID=A0AAV4B938_9GAST|nr:hypothetical protein PoB_004185100 [Plakobranchus ocellatus]